MFESSKDSAGKFRNWAVVSDGHAEYIGKIADDGREEMVLSPVYEWVCPTSVDARQGIVQRGRLALPLATFGSLKRLRIRPTVVIPLDDLDETEAAELSAALERCVRPSGASRILVPTPVLKQ